MTRFKELQRIENAVRHRNKAELEWAFAYCRMRLGLTRRKDHQKYWRKIAEKVRTALGASG